MHHARVEFDEVRMKVGYMSVTYTKLYIFLSTEVHNVTCSFMQRAKCIGSIHLPISK